MLGVSMSVSTFYSLAKNVLPSNLKRLCIILGSFMSNQNSVQQRKCYSTVQSYEAFGGVFLSASI